MKCGYTHVERINRHGIYRRHDDDMSAEEIEDEYSRSPRPRTRGECRRARRPCPWLGCRYHLGLELTEAGSIYYRDLGEMRDTCALDVADRGEHTLQQVGDLLGVTREAIRQIIHVRLRELDPAIIQPLTDLYRQCIDDDSGDDVP